MFEHRDTFLTEQLLLRDGVEQRFVVRGLPGRVGENDIEAVRVGQPIQALGQREGRSARRKAVVEEIKSLSIENSDSFPAPAGLIREDRDR